MATKILVRTLFGRRLGAGVATGLLHVAKSLFDLACGFDDRNNQIENQSVNQVKHDSQKKYTCHNGIKITQNSHSQLLKPLKIGSALG